MKPCLICHTPIQSFMSFGQTPIANGFLTQDQFAKEYFFELAAASCPKCHMFQLIYQPDREQMFNENYPFFSGTSTGMTHHFQKLAEHVQSNTLTSTDPFVVEIGSNDGILLKHFAHKNIRHLGIEPSYNVAQVAIKNRINTISKFFDKECAKKIVNEHGQADVFLGANVMCHIPYLHSVIEGIQTLLKPNGVLIFEDPYLGDVIQLTTFDQIYDEHVFLFSVSSIKYLFEHYGMEVIDVQHQDTHGGSMRYTIAHKGKYVASEAVNTQHQKEEAMGLNKPETYEAFRIKCQYFRKNLLNLLNEKKKERKRVVGYAATSKSTTIINYCGLTPDHIEFICDTTPLKQGKYSPGAHIPIRPYEDFTTHYPDYALLFAYNHMKEIMAKEQNFIKNKGRWIVYVPEIGVLQ